MIPLYSSRHFTQEQALQAMRKATDGHFGVDTACRELERELCRATGAVSAVTAASAEAALENLLAAWSVGDKDAVFVPSFVKPYILFAVMQCGAVPVLVDCDRETWTISPKKLESAVEKCIKAGDLYPRAVIAEDTFGIPFDADAVGNVCTRYGLLLIENVWTAYGAKYKGKKAGTLGDAAIVSFKPPFGISAVCDGGAVLTGDLRLEKSLRPVKSIGAETVRRVGYAQMDEITARLIAPQLENIEEAAEKRRHNAERFIKALHETSVRTVVGDENTVCAYPVFPLCVKNQEDVAVVTETLRKADIEYRCMFSKPLCRQPAFKRLGVQASEIPIGSMLSTCTVALPCHEDLTGEQTEYICDAIKMLCV